MNYARNTKRARNALDALGDYIETHQWLGWLAVIGMIAACAGGAM